MAKYFKRRGILLALAAFSTCLYFFCLEVSSESNVEKTQQKSKCFVWYVLSCSEMYGCFINTQSRCEVVEDKPFPPQACRQKFPPKIASVGFNFFLVNSCSDTVSKVDKIVAGMKRITPVSCCHDNLHACDRTLLNCKG